MKTVMKLVTAATTGLEGSYWELVDQGARYQLYVWVIKDGYRELCQLVSTHTGACPFLRYNGRHLTAAVFETNVAMGSIAWGGRHLNQKHPSRE
jgi:hypothetical protein